MYILHIICALVTGKPPNIFSKCIKCAETKVGRFLPFLRCLQGPKFPSLS